MSKIQVLFDLVFGFECELCFKTNSCGARQMENRHATYQCKLTVSRSLMRCFQRHSGLQTKCFGIFVSFERLCVNTVLFDLWLVYATLKSINIFKKTHERLCQWFFLSQSELLVGGLSTVSGTGTIKAGVWVQFGHITEPESHQYPGTDGYKEQEKVRLPSNSPLRFPGVKHITCRRKRHKTWESFHWPMKSSCVFLNLPSRWQ